MPSFADVIEVSTLDGINGFAMYGLAAEDRLGHRVAFVGDVNGDGFGDFVVGAEGSDLAGTDLGAAYLVYGDAGGFPAILDLANLAASQGRVFTGAGGAFGLGVGGGMDLNDDGRADLVLAAPFLGHLQPGRVYVVYGQAGDFPAGPFAVAGLDGADGSILNGQFLTAAGWAVGAVGDINGDGIEDVGLMGMFGSDTSAYVLFGRDGGFGATLNLAALDGTDGFMLTGLEAAGGRCVSIAGGGDINGDGVDDLIVGSGYGDEGGSSFGGAYVVFGRDTAAQGDFAAALDVTTGIDGTNGFTIQSFQNLMNLGYSVASVGDLNGDGFDDIALGARRADIAASETGAVFVIFGKDTAVSGAFATNFVLGDLDGSNGFWISGELGNDTFGTALAAGDVNGDGLTDLVMGAAFADGTLANAGAAYVLFGRTSGFAARMNVSSLTGGDGFKIVGGAVNDALGMTAATGDINGDGVDDIILGAYRVASAGNQSGAAYVVFGVQADLTLTGTAADEAINGKTGDDTLYGLSGRDTLSGLAGDDTLYGGDMGDLLNGGDGADDLTGGAGGDVLNGDAGDDGLAGGDAGDKLFGGLGIDTLNGDSGADRLDGGDGNDILDGAADNDLLDGGAGADAMTGGLGNDVFLVDNTGDTTVEATNEGFDIVRTALDGWVLAANIEALELQGSVDIDGTGNGGTNNLQGNAGANRLDGGAGVDTINGNDGDDTVVGGLGNDLLRGGLGADVFLVGHVATGALETDQIYDFSTAEGDSLDLTDAFAGTLTLVSAFTKIAGQMTLSFAGGITTLRLDTTGDGRVDYQMKINGDVTGDWGGWAL